MYSECCYFALYWVLGSKFFVYFANIHDFHGMQASDGFLLLES
ncbi:hypothetical protein BPUTEOMOX_2160 [methanotrophic endosymbiont of Bathymodiolus puteoserpentis (Logatchev)]|nr:hypothetical protein BPUTEOMOX_2160 [methanotrophic endosymbiont of Bathymodiolus puteoserpentis (Logatchev)]